MLVEDIYPEKYHDKSTNYENKTDIMDVWFNSGSSWAGLFGKHEDLSFPAYVYLEGTDKHHVWL